MVAHIAIWLSIAAIVISGAFAFDAWRIRRKIERIQERNNGY